MADDFLATNKEKDQIPMAKSGTGFDISTKSLKQIIYSSIILNSRFTLQCNAMQCNAMQCNAMQCNAMQCNAMQCNAMQCNANEMQCNATQYNTTGLKKNN